LEFAGSGLGPGAAIRCEMFENNVLSSPIAAVNVIGPLSVAILDMDGAWADRQGAVRLTMLSGTATLSNIWLKRLSVIGSGQTSDFSTNFTFVPRLEVRVDGPENVQLSWPTNALGYRLEYSEQMPATSWQPVEGQFSSQHSNFVSSVKNIGARYFRLAKP